MRSLIISGDSFTLGSELENKSWAELLADELDYTYINKSIAGVGNAAIARTILEEIPTNSSVVVMWTFLARFDNYVNGNWITTTPNSKSKFDKFFLQNIGNSEFYELHNSLMHIILLQNTLEKYQIPYMFTSADCSWHNMYFTKDKWIKKLLSLIDWSKWYDIDDGNGFYKWGTTNYPCGTYGHPLDQAHVDLVIKIKPFAQKLIGFSN